MDKAAGNARNDEPYHSDAELDALPDSDSESELVELPESIADDADVANIMHRQNNPRQHITAITREESERISMEFLSLGAVSTQKARKLGRNVYKAHVDRITPKRKKFFGGKYDKHKMG